MKVRAHFRAAALQWELFNKGVGLLANLRIRRKLLVALLPLALMVLAATLYSSIEMLRIDKWYTDLIDRDVKALQSLTDARAKTTQFGQWLYKEIAEPIRIVCETSMPHWIRPWRNITLLEESQAREPGYGFGDRLCRPLFDQAVSDARSIREEAMKNDSAAACRRCAKPRRLNCSAHATLDRADQNAARGSRSRVRSLTASPHRTVPLPGLSSDWASWHPLHSPFYCAKEVVDRLEGFRGHILDVADDRLDQPITNLERTDEIGEMSRALNTLQTAARERQTQAWVKAEVAAITVRLQSAESFEEFARILLSRISESVNLLYGIFYLADADGKRFTAAGTFAIGPSTTSQSFSLGEGMAGQAALEQRSLEVIATDEIRFASLPGRGQSRAGISCSCPWSVKESLRRCWSWRRWIRYRRGSGSC